MTFFRGPRLFELQKYCSDIAEFYPVQCEIQIEHGESIHDSDWASVTIRDLTSNGDKRSVTSPQSPAVGCLEAFIDDTCVAWFGGKGA